MKFASVHAAFLRETACLASCAAVGAWVRLYAYAAELERGGKVPVAEHTDRFWNRVAQVTMAEVDEAIGANLCSMSKGVLMVNGYDMKGQRAVESRRKVGKLGGRPAGITNDSTAVKPNGLTHVEPKPNPSPLLSSPLPSSPEEQTPSASPPDRSVFVKVLGGFCKLWGESRGAEYQPTSKDKSQLGRVLSGMGREDLHAIPGAMKAYLADADPFVEKQGWSLAYFLTSGGLNKYRMAKLPSKAPPSTVSLAATDRKVAELRAAQAAPAPTLAELRALRTGTNEGRG